MCQICRSVKNKSFPLSPEETADVLNRIGQKMVKNPSSTHFTDLLDKILGTTVPESNEELDGAWERNHRKDE